VTAKQVDKDRREANVSERTLRRVKRDLGSRRKRRSMAANPRRRHPWRCWQLRCNLTTTIGLIYQRIAKVAKIARLNWQAVCGRLPQTTTQTIPEMICTTGVCRCEGN
jgi:hypothetical protein